MLFSLEAYMDLGFRLKQFRELKQLSQGDIEQRTGLLRCYISRVENGHTVPSLETLEKLARALEVQLYQLFYPYQGSEDNATEGTRNNGDWAGARPGRALFSKLRNALSHMSQNDRDLLLYTAARMASHKRR